MIATTGIVETESLILSPFEPGDEGACAAIGSKPEGARVLPRSPEIAAHRRGYATERAAAALAFGFETLDPNDIIALALPQNTASLKVMERFGMTRRPGAVEVFALHPAMPDIDATTYREKNS